ncbi:MAG: hypothetical protein ABF379_10595 [Akkermansiaceae bacterium]
MPKLCNLGKKTQYESSKWYGFYVPEALQAEKQASLLPTLQE